MTKALTTVEPKLLKVSGAEIGPTFLRLAPGTTKETWHQVTKKVTNIGYGYWWWVGDLAMYAQHNFKEGDDLLREISGNLGVTIQYVFSLAAVSKAYAVKDRIAGLSLHHHLVVRNMPRIRRHKILRMAEQKRWSARILREKTTPLKQRKVTVILRVPTKIMHGKSFQGDLKAFCSDWKISYYVHGTLKPHAGKMRRVSRGALQIA